MPIAQRETDNATGQGDDDYADGDHHQITAESLLECQTDMFHVDGLEAEGAQMQRGSAPRFTPYSS